MSLDSCFANGYYSIVQFCPDPSRMECINTGLVLFCPSHAFLRVGFAPSFNRIRRVFGEQDWDFLSLEQEAIQSRLIEEPFSHLSQFVTYAATRANSLVLTPPRPVKLSDPDSDFDHLLHRLVEASI